MMQAAEQAGEHHGDHDVAMEFGDLLLIHGDGVRSGQ
jgi:hypothetical protein